MTRRAGRAKQERRAKPVMVQGTMSSAGKSLLTAGLCRVFAQEGYSVAPFKGQNMALNSFVTADGLEMGRAQVVQAEAAGIAPDVRMNPVLLKPTSDTGSQLIVMGEVRGTYQAREYYAMKRALTGEVQAAYDALAAEHDVIVIEGAGSPAEINLRADDFVNMGMAKMAQAPVLLVGDIDRGGVFAQLLGTLALLEPDERAMVKALVVNKFRGDVSLLQSGLDMLAERTGVPVAGVLPYLKVDIEDEDSLSERLTRQSRAAVDIAVIRLPRISNFTDFMALEMTQGLGVRYVASARELGEPDMVVLPGTKSTVADLLWLRQNGLEAAIKKHAARGGIVLGICGGYQMLGRRIVDECGSEGAGRAEVAGIGLLDAETVFAQEKRRVQVSGAVLPLSGALADLSGAAVEGYEIHMGRTALGSGARPMLRLQEGAGGSVDDGAQGGSVYGCYLHGLFDAAELRGALAKALHERKGLAYEGGEQDLHSYKQRQYDALADAVRTHLDMELIHKILRGGIG